MARYISPPQATDETIIPAGSSDIPLTYFRLVTLEPGEIIVDRQYDLSLIHI